jgi:hypothetical protein
MEQESRRGLYSVFNAASPLSGVILEEVKNMGFWSKFAKSHKEIKETPAPPPSIDEQQAGGTLSPVKQTGIERRGFIIPAWKADAYWTNSSNSSTFMEAEHLYKAYFPEVLSYIRPLMAFDLGLPSWKLPNRKPNWPSRQEEWVNKEMPHYAVVAISGISLTGLYAGREVDEIVFREGVHGFNTLERIELEKMYTVLPFERQDRTAWLEKPVIYKPASGISVTFSRTPGDHEEDTFVWLRGFVIEPVGATVC